MCNEKHDSCRYLSKQVIPLYLYQKNTIHVNMCNEKHDSCRYLSKQVIPLERYQKNTIPVNVYLIYI